MMFCEETLSLPSLENESDASIQDTMGQLREDPTVCI